MVGEKGQHSKVGGGRVNVKNIWPFGKKGSTAKRAHRQ